MAEIPSPQAPAAAFDLTIEQASTDAPLAAAVPRPTVVSFAGRERLSTPYRMWIKLRAAEGPEFAARELIGRRATLEIHAATGGARLMHGVFTHARRSGPLDGAARVVDVCLCPMLSLLRHRRTRRVFQDMTADEVVASVLSDGAIAARWSLRRRYEKREYCVQHDETDLSFIQRLLAEEGIFYYFEHPRSTTGQGSEVIVFGDSPEYPWIDTPGDASKTLLLRSHGGDAVPGHDDDVTAFSLRFGMGTTEFVARDYDYRRPLLDLRAAAHDAGSAPGAPDSSTGGVHGASSLAGGRRGELLRVDEHGGDYDQPDVTEPGAATALEQLRRKCAVGAGRSTCRRLLPGYRFALEHQRDGAAELAGDYVITRVDHEGHTPELTGHHAVYENRFRCLPAELPARPARQPRRLQRGAETAVVVGPAGEELHTDVYGRIKVRFHWEPSTLGVERSTCWLRVTQPWAGSSWGFQFIPRVGMEVLVSYLDGDPNRPVVSGCLYNRVLPPTHLLPENATRSGIRTRSTPAAEGYNEIAFEDRSGAEELSMHAERDLRAVVKRDRTETIGGSEHVEIAGAASRRIGTSCDTTIGGACSQTVAGDLRRATEGEETFTTRKARTEKIGGDLTVGVSGAESHTIGGALATTVAKGAVLEVKGRFETRAGTKDEGATLDVRGDYSIKTSGRVAIVADKGLSVTCGGTTFEIGPELVQAMTKSIVLAASRAATVFGNGPMLELGDTLTVAAKSMKLVAAKDIEVTAPDKIRLTTKKASVRLDEDAAVNGTKLRLNCKPELPPESDEEAPPENKEEPEKSFLRIVPKDPRGRPYGKKKYVLFIDGAQFAQGVSGDDGLVEHEIKKAASSGELRLEIAEGREIVLPLDIGKLGAITTTRGVKARLKNLGYYLGPVDDQLDDATTRAVAGFQRESELEATGTIDDATRAKLLALTTPE